MLGQARGPDACRANLNFPKSYSQRPPFSLGWVARRVSLTSSTLIIRIEKTSRHHLVTFGVNLSPSAPRRTFISGASASGGRCVLGVYHSRPLSGLYLVVGPAGQHGTGEHLQPKPLRHPRPPPHGALTSCVVLGIGILPPFGITCDGKHTRTDVHTCLRKCAHICCRCIGVASDCDGERPCCATERSEVNMLDDCDAPRPKLSCLAASSAPRPRPQGARRYHVRAAGSAHSLPAAHSPRRSAALPTC